MDDLDLDLYVEKGVKNNKLSVLKLLKLLSEAGPGGPLFCGKWLPWTCIIDYWI